MRKNMGREIQMHTGPFLGPFQPDPAVTISSGSIIRRTTKESPTHVPLGHSFPKPGGERRRRKQRQPAGHGVVVDPGGRPRDAEGSGGPGKRPKQDPERHLEEPPGPQAVHHPGRRERARPQGVGAAGRWGERVQAHWPGAGQAGPRGGQGQRQEAHRVHLGGAEADGSGAEGFGGQAEQQEGIDIQVATEDAGCTS